MIEGGRDRMMSQPAPPARTASRRRGRPLLWVAAVLACVVLVSVGVVLYGEYKIHAPQGAGSNPVLFSVVSGDLPTTIANRLQQRGILHNSLLFKIDSRLRGLGGRLYAGTYTLRPNMSIDQMISTLESFRVRRPSITIPPGWRATEIAELLTSHGINGRDFMHAVNHPQYRFGFEWRTAKSLLTRISVSRHISRRSTHFRGSIRYPHGSTLRGDIQTQNALIGRTRASHDLSHCGHGVDHRKRGSICLSKAHDSQRVL